MYLWLIAQTDNVPFWIDALAKLGVAGVLAILLWFLLVKYVPSIEKRHELERKEWRAERDEWRQYLQQKDKQFEGMLTGLENILKDLQHQNVLIMKILEKYE